MACVVRGIAVIVVVGGVAVSTTNDGADGSCKCCSEVRIGRDGGSGSTQCVLR